MLDWKEALKIKNIATEFEDVNENLQEDLSSVHMQVIPDSHDEGFELEVFIFGKPEEEPNLPVVHVRIPNSCGLMDQENRLSDGSVSPAAVIRIFDPEFIKLLIAKDIGIIWNADMPAQKLINLLQLETSISLQPQYS